MQADYKVRYIHEDVITAATAACWKAAPPDRIYIFDVIKLIEVLVTSGIDHVFHIKGDRHKGHLEIEFFDRRKKWWEKPAWVTFGKKVKLTVDQAVWAAAKAAQLLLDAHESVRSTNIESEFVRAACVASAIFTLSPIREIGSNSTHSEEIKRLNELCALKAAGSLLGFDSGNLDKIVTMSKFRNAGMSFSFEYLTSLIQRGDKIIASSSTVLHFRDLPLYYDYNESNDISWREVHALDNLAKILALWKAGRPARSAN